MDTCVCVDGYPPAAGVALGDAGGVQRGLREEMDMVLVSHVVESRDVSHVTTVTAGRAAAVESRDVGHVAAAAPTTVGGQWEGRGGEGKEQGKEEEGRGGEKCAEPCDAEKRPTHARGPQVCTTKEPCKTAL